MAASLRGTTLKLTLTFLLSGLLTFAGCGLSNEPPDITRLIATPLAVEQGRSSTIECIASDPDGDELSYQWEANGGSFSGEGPTVIWWSPLECDTFDITATVSDGRGGEVSSIVYIRVKKPG
jgi:hypothetical protein